MTLQRPALACLVFLCVVVSAVMAQAQVVLKTDETSFVPSTTGPPGTYDISLDWSLVLETDISAPISASQTFRVEVNGVAVSTAAVSVDIDPGSGPSFCAPPACTGTCGSIVIDGQPHSLECEPDGCGCESPTVTTSLASAVPLDLGDELCIVQPPSIPGGPEMELGCLTWGTINRRILDVQVQPQSAPADPSMYQIVVDLGVDVSASSTLPLKLLSEPIVSVECEELNPDDCGACCGEACDCGGGGGGFDHFFDIEVDLPGEAEDQNPLLPQPGCLTIPGTECSSSTTGTGVILPGLCDAATSRCTTAAGRTTYENITLERGARIVVRMDYTDTSLPELYDDGDVVDFQFEPAVSAPPLSRSGLHLAVSPNPFNPATQVNFAAEAGAEVVVRVYDGRGRLLETMFEGRATGAEQTLTWRAHEAPSGVYFVSIESDGAVATEKVALLK